MSSLASSINMSNFSSRALRKLNRTIAGPFRQMGVAVGENDRRILALKDAHAGRRAFVIGNGPSLKVADLDRLKSEVTFASNKIYLAFDQTSWRPTYYSVCDKLVARNNVDAIHRLKLTKIFSDQVQDLLKPDDSIIWFRELTVRKAKPGPGEDPDTAIGEHFCPDALVGTYGGATIVYNQLQLAFYMGITEVVLIGVDFSFKIPDQREATTLRGYEVSLKSEGEVNHFHPDYRKPGEAWGVPNLAAQEYSFRTANHHFLAAGRKIVNASRQTKLEVFPRANLDELLP